MVTSRRDYLVQKFGQDRVSRMEASLEKGENILDLLGSLSKDFGSDGVIEAVAFFKEVLDDQGKAKKPGMKPGGGGAAAANPEDEDEDMEDEEAAGGGDNAKKAIDAIIPQVMEAIGVEGLKEVLRTLSEGQVALSDSVVNMKESHKQEIATLKGQIQMLSDAVNQVAKDDDTKIAEQFKAINWGSALVNRPTGQKSNALSDAEALPEAKATWLSSAFS